MNIQEFVKVKFSYALIHVIYFLCAQVFTGAQGVTGLNLSDTGLKEQGLSPSSIPLPSLITAFRQTLDALPNLKVLQADRCCGEDPGLSQFLAAYLQSHPGLEVLSIAGSRKDNLMNAGYFISSLADNITLLVPPSPRRGHS